MKDPGAMQKMMDRMMSDPKMVEMMSRHMAEHSDQMAAHMDSMMKTPEHRRAMVEMMRSNPNMRQQMQSVINEAEKPAAQRPK